MRRSPGSALWYGLVLGICGGAVGAAEAPGKTGIGPPKVGRWEPIPELTDEFDGTRLDESKWHPRNPRWLGRQPGYFSPDNVTVRDGKLHLTMRRQDLPKLPKGYHTFTSAAVQSKVRVKYGYFEIRAKPMDSKGSSAFWFYDNTPEIWTEIDVFEMGARHPKHEHIDHMNLHVFRTLANPDRHWAKPTQYKTPWRLADGYHVYALEWGPDVLKFSIDGKVVRTSENTHWHQPLTLNFDSETMPKWFGLPDAKNLPSTFSIEYIRSWRRTDPPKNLPKSLPIQYAVFGFPGEPAPALAGKSRQWRLGSDEQGELFVVARFNHKGERTHVHLEYRAPKYFAGLRGKFVDKRIRTIKDQAGRSIDLLICYEKVAKYKPNHGWRADRLRIEPPDRGKTGEKRTYRFDVGKGQIVEMTVTF